LISPWSRNVIFDLSTLETSKSVSIHFLIHETKKECVKFDAMTANKRIKGSLGITGMKLSLEKEMGSFGK